MGTHLMDDGAKGADGKEPDVTSQVGRHSEGEEEGDCADTPGLKQARDHAHALK